MGDRRGPEASRLPSDRAGRYGARAYALGLADVLPRGGRRARMSWLEQLDGELKARGVPGRARRRIVLEFEDHLRCDPASRARLGDPAALAQAFADDLASSTSRKAAIGSFGLLALVGALVSALLLP